MTNEFSAILEKIMNEHNLNQKQLAKKVGLTQSAISKYLNSQTPSFDIGIKILSSFGYHLTMPIHAKENLNEYDVDNEYQKEVILSEYKHLKNLIKEKFGTEYL